MTGCIPNQFCVPESPESRLRADTGLTLKSASVCFGLLAANEKFPSRQRVTGEIKERGSGSSSSVHQQDGPVFTPYERARDGDGGEADDVV